jgi:DNA (cytosine-5)-methyltransferase 1
MTSPPCQAFSLAGKRKGKEDLRGILFFNSLEFIQNNNPRFFIFENVKGLLSDDGGNTFQEWVNYLGGKSVNGVPILFPYDGSVNYHLYWQVLNAKKHGVPQNRERVF